MCVANPANVTIINIDPHTDGFVDDLFLVHLNAFYELVSDLICHFGDTGVFLYKICETADILIRYPCPEQ